MKQLNKNLIMVFLGGVGILSGVVMVNTTYKLLSALLIIGFGSLFFYGLSKLK